MGKRNTGRKLAMQLLYQADIRKKPIELIIQSFLSESPFIDETKEWTVFLANGAWEKKEILDQIIKKYSIGWDLDRMNLVDKNLLRTALFELRFTDTPINVVLNEVIEIAKRYSTDDSPKFINGLLGNYVKDECLLES